jgi:hypothetical protein
VRNVNWKFHLLISKIIFDQVKLATNNLKSNISEKEGTLNRVSICLLE